MKLKALIAAGVLAIAPVAVVALPSVVEAKPVCSGGIQDRRTSPNSYTAQCGSGQGWIEADVTCLSPNRASAVSRSSSWVFRNWWEGVTRVQVRCTSSHPIIYTGYAVTWD
jgi:hypothetical protein